MWSTPSRSTASSSSTGRLPACPPDLTSLQTNRLPAGAIQGQNDFGKAGYEICPPGSAETYVFTLYALPKRLRASKGFDPHQLREEILAQSGNAGLMAAGYGG